MNNILVSIIVPVHNAGELLKRCLDSLINQTLREIEIILILDCPTDGSDLIAKEYAQQDSRIKIIQNQTNLHIGNSRNEGLKIAQGKYIGFNDHDDYADPQMYELLYRKAEDEQLDLVCSPYVIVKGDEITCMNDFPEELQAEEFAQAAYACSIGADADEDYNVLNKALIWKNLYRLDIIKRHQITFVDTNYISAEDICFMVDYTRCIQRAGFIASPLYYHDVGINSNTGKTYSYLQIEKRSALLEYVQNHLHREGVFDKYKTRWQGTVRNILYYSLLIEYRSIGVFSVVKKILKIRKNKELKRAFRDGNTLSPPYQAGLKSKIAFDIVRFLIAI
ncbi:MAG: glycosyltransferase family 2 protein [Mangrovibacterium sp.]